MQAARAARRKANILAAAGDRMAIVEGAEVPKASEKRLVLEDDEMDPALAVKAGAARAAAAPEAVSEAESAASGGAAVEPAVAGAGAADPAGLIDAALDDVFNEVTSRVPRLC